MTAASFQDAPFPTPATDPPPRSSGRRPRNFLSAAEHRKLFWRFMPPAVVAVVLLELLTRSGGPPPVPREPQVETRIEAVAGPPPAADAVQILPPDEPLVLANETELSASPRSLAQVRDATFFRQADHDAWLESCLTLRGYEGRSLPPPRDVGFTEVFGQPASFRGRAVRMRGTLHRLERLQPPANDYGIDGYWQGWLEPAGGPASPVIVHFLELPEGMATGLEIHEPVVVEGCFFKNMAYKASDGVRVAPLLMARVPRRPPVSAGDPAGGLLDLSLGVIGVVSMLAIVGTIAVGFWLVGGRRRRPAVAAELDAALADVRPFSITESLGQVAAEEAARGPGPSQEHDS